MAQFKLNYGLIERLQSTATAAGTTTLANNSRTHQQFTGTTTQTVVLPQANAASPNECPLSLEFVIMNRSTGAVTVNYNGGSLAKTLSANQQAVFRLVDNSTSTGTWDITNEAAGVTGVVSLSSLEKLGALAALGNEFYQDSQTTTTQIKVNPEEIGGAYSLSKSSLLVAKDVIAAHTLNGYNYETGGRTTPGNQSTGTNTHNRYSDDANYWLARANTASAFGCADALSGYLFGGIDTSSTIVSTVRIYNDSTNSWSTGASMPTALRHMGRMAPQDGLYYLVAGLDAAGSGFFNLNQAYNTTSNSFYLRQVLPVSVFENISFTINGIGYVACGQASGSIPNSTYRYDTAANTFTTLAATMTGARTSCGSYSMNGSGYAAAGINNGGSFYTSVERFDPSTAVWSVFMNTYQVDDVANAATSLNGFGYLAGGNNTGSNAITTYTQFVDTTFFTIPGIKRSTSAPASIFVAAALSGLATSLPVRLRTDGDNWKTLAANTDSALKLSETLTTKFIETPLPFVCSGHDGSATTYRNIESYDFNSNTWTAISSNMATLRALGACFTSGGFGYIAAGFNVSNLLTVEKYDSILKSFSSATSLSTAKRNLSGYSLNGFGYIAGGLSTVIIAAVERFSPALNSWSTMTSLSAAKSHASPFELGQLIFAGGSTTGAATDAVTTVEAYSDILNSWTTKATLPSARVEACGAAVGGFGYVVAGWDTTQTDQNTNYKFNLGTNSWSTSTACNTAVSLPSGMRSTGTVMKSGGQNGTTGVNTTEAFNPDASVWSNRANLNATHGGNSYGSFGPNPYRNYELQVGLPTYLAALGGFQTVTRANMLNIHSNGQSSGYVDGKSYMWDSGSTGNSNSEVYTHETNTWISWVISPSSYNGGCGQFVLGGTGYIASGVGGTTYQVITQLATYVNKSVSPPNPRFRTLQPASNPLNGYGYWYGGDQNNSSTLLNSIDQYNPATNTWATKASSNANSPRYVGGFQHNGIIYVTGGNPLSGFNNQTDSYNDASNAWTLKVNYPISATNQFTSKVTGVPLNIGGYTGSISSSCWIYNDAQNIYVAQANFVGGGRENMSVDNVTGLLFGGDPGTSADNLTWKIIPAIKNVMLGAGLRVS